MEKIKISGTVAKGFESVIEAYESNFYRDDIYKELGSSLSVYHKGKQVVDLWAGYKDREKTELWTKDTMIALYSTTKGITGLCMALLVERGLVNYSDLVSKHWPEFGQNGKENTTISHIMSHQSGNPGLREFTLLDELMNWDLICDRLARQAPYWKSGEFTSYHGWTVGFLAGEIIRRVSGKTVGDFLQSEIAKPLDAKVFVGLPENEHINVATLYKPLTQHQLPDLITLPNFLASAVGNPVLDAESPNRKEWREAEMPALNGHSNAEGLAKLYNPLAENAKSESFNYLSSQTIDKMTTVASSRLDAMIGSPVDWAHGVTMNTLDLKLYGENKKAFGHSGWGGSFGCADRENRIAIGYVCNQMGPDTVGDARTPRLIKAIYDSIK
ncbi:serine hydrolase domain-containing protein [Aquimarina sp. RZ0]|uniref:serine hydrolase domain-containing protein n=1 Tax=Aquimarina sp. RZ0 TaxID=2607730 RepID=UPI0011F3C0DC|nr:serine hydrolase domain-containing protein [Aquimarina sp. RZ0]KAA1245622.1 beta-lactamase family protein [Aquimarina sp. RZ0]